MLKDRVEANRGARRDCAVSLKNCLAQLARRRIRITIQTTGESFTIHYSVPRKRKNKIEKLCLGPKFWRAKLARRRARITL